MVPAHRRDAPHALLRAIIGKVPTAPAELAKEMDKFNRAISRAEKLHEEPKIEGDALTVDRLAEWLVVELAAHATPMQRELSTTY